jgi:hypothetical protein
MKSNNNIILPNNNYDFKPFLIYNNSWLNKPKVLKENKGKSGIYR